MFANVSVGQLFLAGIVPGVVMAILMMFTVAYYAHKNKWGRDIAFKWSKIGKALLELAIVVGFPTAIWGHGRHRAVANIARRCGCGLLWQTAFSASTRCCRS